MTLSAPFADAGSRWLQTLRRRSGDPQGLFPRIRSLPAFWKCRRNADGFTLIETLVVLALVATMTGLMAISISQVGKIRETQKQELEEMRLLDSLRVMKTDLGNAISIPLISTENADRAVLLGSAGEIVFVAYVAVGFRSWGLREVRYLLKVNKDGRHYLVRELRPHRFAREPLKDSDVETIVLGAFEATRFQFRERNASSGFVDSWRTEPDFPSVVQIELTGGNRPVAAPRSIILYP